MIITFPRREFPPPYHEQVRSALTRAIAAPPARRRSVVRNRGRATGASVPSAARVVVAGIGDNLGRVTESRAEAPPTPDPLPLAVVDNHTHLDHVRGSAVGMFPDDAEVERLIAAAVAVNVDRMVQIGCDLPAARWTIEAVETHPQLLGGVALHPTEATKHAAAQGFELAFTEIEKLAAHPRIRVVGETGLDYHWVEDDAGRAAQQESFRRHIDLAKRLGKVLQIHDRDAHDDVLRILAEEGAPELTVFHCFSGDAAMARVCTEQGWYLSFAGTLTFKNAGALREALAAVPSDRVLVETDAPYLTPVPYRGRPNASYLVPHTVAAMAEVTGRDVALVCAELAANSATVYGDWQTLP